MVVKKITVGDTEVTFKASAATLRLYRNAFGKDMLSEIKKMETILTKASKLKASDQEEKQMEAFNSDFIENLAWIMAGMPNGTVEKWLEKFGSLDFIIHAEEILEVWYSNLETTVQSKNAEAAEN